MSVKEEIISLLESTGRKGIELLIGHMELSGFFDAPCSGQYHLCKEGGLAEHSLNVYQTMYKINEALGCPADRNEVIICSLLHDLGKMGDHFKPNYVENLVKSKTKNKETGEYDMVRSTAKPYSTNKDLLYIDHEIRSIAIAERFIYLSEEEEHAILFHNGMYSNLKYALKETPLMLLLHYSDLWCARVIEKED